MYICTKYVVIYIIRTIMKEENNPKRELILKTGKELFWKFGFKRVTVEELCREAGISKMTYYKFFPNKIELVKTLMNKVLEEALEKYRKISASDIPYPEKVIQMIHLKQEQVNTMSSEFFRDYVQSDDPDLINFLNQLTQENLQMFTNDFKKAQEDGDIRAGLKVEFIMYMMNHLVEMAQDDTLLDMYDEPQDLVMEIINFLFYGILSRDVHEEDPAG
jgi:AcrR family transcriptional regulator